MSLMAKAAPKNQKSTLRYEAVKIEPLFEVLDAVAFIDSPTTKDIAQYANIDGRTAGKLLKNARLIGLVQSPDDNTYVLSQPYPYKGTLDEKRRVVREALLRLPLIQQHPAVHGARKRPTKRDAEGCDRGWREELRQGCDCARCHMGDIGPGA